MKPLRFTRSITRVINSKQARTISHPYKTPKAPSGVPSTKNLARLFPLSIKDSFRDFLKRKDTLHAQDELLATLPFFSNPDSSRYAKVHKVDIGEGKYINEFCIYPNGKSEDDFDSLKHLVMVHGYGAGLGFFIKNYDPISAYGCDNDWVIHSIDLLGYGCSSRPPFPWREPLDSEIVSEWFSDSLLRWFHKRGLQNTENVMCAHSLGGYLSAVFNMRHPGFFKKLLMISPAGVSIPDVLPVIPKWFERLWNRNISPFSIVRYAGPFGSYFVSGWTCRRFAMLSSTEQKLLHQYAYRIFNAKGSGEYVLNYLLAAGGIPRRPLIKEIHNIQCDVVWCYGTEDWMDLHGGRICKDVINNSTRYKSRYVILERSGHHLFLDNCQGFNELVIREMAQQ